MDDARLDRGQRKRRRHAVGQAFEAVADQEEDVLDAPVEVGQHGQPELGRFAVAVTGPYPQDVFVAVEIDPDRGLGPVP